MVRRLHADSREVCEASAWKHAIVGRRQADQRSIPAVNQEPRARFRERLRRRQSMPGACGRPGSRTCRLSETSKAQRTQSPAFGSPRTVASKRRGCAGRAFPPASHRCSRRPRSGMAVAPRLNARGRCRAVRRSRRHIYEKGNMDRIGNPRFVDGRPRRLRAGGHARAASDDTAAPPAAALAAGGNEQPAGPAGIAFRGPALA